MANTQRPGGSGRPPRSSRARYRAFRTVYRTGRLGADGAPLEAEPSADAAPPSKLARGRRLIGEYLRRLKPHRLAVAGVGALALLAAGMQMVEPLFMRFMIDRVLLNGTLDAATRLRWLNLAGAAFVGFMLASNLVNVLKDYRLRLLNVRVMLSLRRALYDHLLHLPLPRLWEMKTGGILSRITGDVETTTGMLQLAVVSPAVSVVRLLVAGGVLFVLNWRLAVTALAIVPGVMAMSVIFARRIRPIYRSIRKDVEDVDGRVGETFSGIRVVRAFGREAREMVDYLVGRHTVLRKELFAQRREMVLWTSWNVLLGLVNVAIIWYGGYLNLQGGATIGDIMAFQLYSMLLLNPVWQLVNSFSEIQRSLAAMERVFEVLDLPHDKPDRPDAIHAPRHVDSLVFDGVEFAYREGQPVVRDFSVTVPGGSVIALVGRSGAGKTTVTDLVARFHDPTAGAIRLNGVDIRDCRLTTYRDLIAIVQQDVFLFDGSVRDNIAYGRAEATAEEVEDAARRANAHEFIEKLPQGYDTFIGERGVKLSGGQCQRLAIARAVLKAPQILILDEATSNLDTESEQLIQASMATLLASRTTFVIAHRLSTIRRADLILLMDEGRVIERGTHDALMQQQGAYAEMVHRQNAQHQGQI